MDNPITASLPANMPTNWTQYQVVSPNGTEAGLDKQHGYNYLMEQVNNAQNAAKECGEAFESMTGADIPVSSSDQTSISTALSNKADKSINMLVASGDVFIAPTSWAEVWALKPGRYTWVQTGPLDWEPDDTPSGSLRVVLEVDYHYGSASQSYICKLAYIDGAANLTRYFGEYASSDLTTGRLAKIATAKAPQSYNLPLADGWTAPSGAKYQKTQDNMVELNTGGIQLDSGTSVSDGNQIATLPAGFRPRDYMIVPAVAQDGNTRTAVAVQIAASGEVIYNGPSNTTHPFRIFINACYFVG